ncbi:alpha amylase family protein, partial [Alistipes dispar]
QFFLDEAARRDLEVTVSTTIFPAGLTATRQGPVFRDAAFDGRTCIEYMPDGTLLDIRDDKAINVAFLNPAMPENQEWALRFIREILSKYRFDGYALDYCRYPGATADFSEFSRREFERFLGHAVERFPEDIFTYDEEGNRIPGKYYKPWWEYRAKVVRDFIARVRAAVDELQPDVRLEYWAGSWLHAIYANGQNWGSPRSTFSDEYLDTWATPGYKEAGFADLLDVFITGTYLERVWGADDNESIEYGLNRSLRDVAGDCTVYGSLYAQNHLDQFDDAVYLCLKKTKGVMVFDIVQVIEHDLWDSIKRGIDRAEAEIANEGK